MKYHECMHLGGQQQFHAAHSLYMKVVLRSLNVRNAIVCSSCCWFLSIVRVPLSNIFSDCTVPKGCFFRLSLGLKMVEVCWSNLTLPIPYSSFNFCFLTNIEFQSHGVRCFQPSYSQGTAEIHLSSPAHSPHYPPTPAINSPTPTAGFLFVMYERGGTDVQLHISAAIHHWEQGSVFQDSDKVSRYLSVGARGASMPIENREARFEYRGSRIENREISTREMRIESRESRIGDRGSRIENREAGSEDRGSWIEDRELRIENGELRIENRESRSEDRGSRIENGACQAGSGKLMRMADRFRTEWKFQCSNASCCFQMILHLSFEN